MLLDLPNLWIALLNIIGIPVVHLALAWLATALPASRFADDSKFYRFTEMEKSGWLYHRVFFIRKWKHFLPDGAPWFKGFPKGNLYSVETDYLQKFVVETRRGEWSHWIQLIIIIGFTIWTPMPSAIVIVAYSLLVNLPCILNLRYTRMRLIRVLDKRLGN